MTSVGGIVMSTPNPTLTVLTSGHPVARGPPFSRIASDSVDIDKTNPRNVDLDCRVQGTPGVTRTYVYVSAFDPGPSPNKTRRTGHVDVWRTV